MENDEGYEMVADILDPDLGVKGHPLRHVATSPSLDGHLR